MIKKKKILLIILFVIIGAAFCYFFLKIINKGSIIEKTTDGNLCLRDNEIADYKIEKIDEYYGETQIVVKDEKSGTDKFSFGIQNTRLSVHPIEIHKCGIYLIREFNINYAKSEFLPNFNYTLWKYDYTGNSTKLITLAERKKEQKLVIYYSTEFRISPQEKYLALIRGSLGSSNYALVIKDLNTLQDVFVLPITEIEKQKPEMVQDIEFQTWTKDGRYFWLDTHDGANILGYIRIDSTDWNVDYLLSPKDVLGGDALNVEKGLITVHPGNIWFGIADMTQQEKNERKSKGIGTELYIENLFTQEKTFVVSTTEPLHYFRPQWLSDTELQYELPSGEKKVYKIEQ